MLNKLSLKTKTFILLITISVITTLPLIIYYNKTASALSLLASDKDIEKGLVLSIDRAKGTGEKESAVLGLKKYSQIQALKSSIVKQVFVFTIIYFFAVMAVALLMGYIFISRITKPLKDLTLATRELANDNLDIRLPVESGGEIGVLEESFNKMMMDLKEAREQRIIAERRATWQNVARTVAHEIKNPLTPIKLSTERMYDKFINGAEDFPSVIKSTTSTILMEIENLQKLVETFHQYAKFPDPVFTDVSLNGLIMEVVGLFSHEKTQISHDLDPRIPILPLDKGQLKQAFTNLIKNALQAMEGLDREGRIKVTASLDKEKVLISIEDNGCGIPEENRKRLFEPYFTTKKQGSGIGLALTERIINLHGARILFTSREGEGTVFKIILPIDMKVLGETRRG